MKHAFLIMAHAQVDLLRELLQKIDSDRVDIFLHIDLKSNISIEKLELRLKHSKLFFTPKVNVSWGGYSIVYAEYLLLKEATNRGVYEYYHFISGQDYLLKPVDEVLSRFDDSKGCNYISYKNEVDKHLDRLRYYYPLQEYVGRSKKLLYIIQRIIVKAQKILKIERNLPDSIGFGSQFFDITDDFARFIVNSYDNWKKWYRKTVCADEMFVQTLFMLYSKDNYGHCKLIKECSENISTVTNADATIYRAIDWKRGSPYIWTIDDYDFLISSNLLFARKIDYFKSKELINALNELLQSC